MRPEEREALEEAQRAADARRAALLGVSKSERLRLVAELCRQASVLPRKPGS